MGHIVLLPFIPLFAAGFMYNTLCDADKDPKEKNPVTQGAVSEKFVLIAIILNFLLSLFFVILIYSSKVAIILAVLYIFLWLSYSGIKIRFKESIVGPVVASIGFFVLPSVMLLSQFNYFSFGSIMLILGLFMIYFGHEIKHTIIEYELDLSYNCRTFAVILGKKDANIVEYVSIIIGYFFLLASIYYFIPNYLLIILFTIIFMFSMISTVTYGIKTNFDQSKDVLYNILPYIATRFSIITLGLLILNLPILIVLFVIWILFTDRYL